MSNEEKKIRVCLAGNPNTGKTTLFNELTGSEMHVGNWPGKTVELAIGHRIHRGVEIQFIDLPGTYSLYADSPEEEIAKDFLLYEKPDAVIVVVDITQLQRNLNLLFQIFEITDRVVVALTMVDILEAKNIDFDLQCLESKLGVPVIPVVAILGKGIEQLLDVVVEIAKGKPTNPPSPKYPVGLEIALLEIEREIEFHNIDSVPTRWLALRLLEKTPSVYKQFKRMGKKSLLKHIDTIRSRLSTSPQKLIVSSIFHATNEIATVCVPTEIDRVREPSRRIDNIVLNKFLAFPFVIGVFGILFWITLYGATPFTDILAKAFDSLYNLLSLLFAKINTPWWVNGLILDGLVMGIGAVISVMLPTMLIFFTLFALMEDSGIIPRIAFNLDRVMHSVGTQGKHCLTCILSYGCNIPGVYSTRILKGRDRFIAILTANLNPCNGRLGPMMALSILFFGKNAAWAMLFLIVLSWTAVLLTTFVLSNTLYRGKKSPFIMEMPPYRKPYIWEVIKRTIKNKVIDVLSRAVLIAAPFTILIWAMSNIPPGQPIEHTITGFFTKILSPLGVTMGLNGKDLLALVFALPAKEIMIASLSITYGLANTLAGTEKLFTFLQTYWEPAKALSFLVFYMFYAPCLVTIAAIYRETKKVSFTILATFVSLIIGVVFASAVYQLANLFF